MAAYLPVLRAGFVWNDTDLTDGIMLREDGLYRVWLTTEASNYWPLTWTSYWLEHQAWGLEPTGYHVVNIALHVAASLLGWCVLMRLGVPGAWLAALLFAVHPVNVESVAWITQRKNLLCMVFASASLLLFLRARAGGRRLEYWPAVGCFLLSMLGKGAAVGLPIVLLLCIWWQQGTPGRRDVLLTLPFVVVALVMGCVEVWFQYVRSIGETVVRDDSLAERLAGAGWVIWFYLGKALWPSNLTFVYPRWHIDATAWMAHVPNLCLLLVAAAAWRRREGWGRSVLFALGCYVVLLGPVLGFFDIYFMKYSFVADHYQYVAILAPIALAAAAVGHVCSTAGTPGRWLAGALGLVVAGLFAFMTFRQAHIYRDNEALWRDTLQRNPACSLAHYNLAVLLLKQGNVSQAERHLQAARELDPRDGWALANLGTIHQARGQLDQAIACYAQALQLDPRIPAAHANWADILQQRGAYAQAVVRYQAALRIDPRYAAAHNNLGNVLQRMGRRDEAFEHYRLALQSEPHNVQAQKNLDQLQRQRDEQQAPQ